MMLSKLISSKSIRNRISLIVSMGKENVDNNKEIIIKMRKSCRNGLRIHWIQ